MKKFLCFVFLCITPLCSFAQTEQLITSANLRQELNKLFQTSSIAQQAAVKQEIKQHIALNPVTAGNHFKSTSPGLVNQHFSQSHSPKATTTNGSATRPWQIALFVAVDDQNRLNEALGVLRYQINQSTLQHAAVLDIAPRSSGGKPGHHASGGESSIRKTAKLYFLYRGENGKAATQTRAISGDTESEELLAALFGNLKSSENTLYTGIIFSAHGSGLDMGYNGHGIEVSEILSSANEQTLHIDVLEMDSCHMSSLYNTYYASKHGNVDFISGSSDYEYGTPANTRLFPLLSFLNYNPEDAVRLSVDKRAGQFNFWEGGYGTTSYSALYMPDLQEALLNWYEQYAFLRMSTDDNINEVFEKFLKNDETWRSLTWLVRKQKEYIQNHFAELTSDYDNFDEIKTAFINASENLLQAAAKATVTQWCYSSAYNHLYRHDIPNNDCMQSISADRSQFAWLWDEQANNLRDSWRSFTFPRWRHF